MMPCRLTTQGHEGIVCPKDMVAGHEGLYSLKIWQSRPREDLWIFVDWQPKPRGDSFPVDMAPVRLRGAKS